jgi:hypothetical protein
LSTCTPIYPIITITITIALTVTTTVYVYSLSAAPGRDRRVCVVSEKGSRTSYRTVVPYEMVMLVEASESRRRRSLLPLLLLLLLVVVVLLVVVAYISLSACMGHAHVVLLLS